jgi:hypothetical protein
MKQKIWLLISVLVILAMAVPAYAQAPEPDAPTPNKSAIAGNYIVQMINEPVVSYTGGVKGYRATASNGTKINPNSPSVVAYSTFLVSTHNNALAAVGGQKFYSYVYTFNGFAAKMTADQVAAMKQQPGVLSVTPDEVHFADTVTTPAFLGLSAPGGLWDQVGGIQMAGAGVIVGIIDSGIWPENLSFAKTPALVERPWMRWYGKCATGEDWTADLCNGKIIGARFYNAAWGGDAGIDADRPWEFNSPRDYNGHGSHTASTSAGNNGVDALLPNGDNLGQISGMAPQARLAVYKALWSTQDASTASGATSDLVAAIDQAVADGVDVINYSISGSLTNFNDPVEIAFGKAARAGVFVAASAGNSGPTASTVAHNSPWLTTVAAGTHDRSYQATVTLGNGAVYTGISIGSGTPELPVILSTAAGLPGANATAVRLCYTAGDNGGVAVLDPAKVAGKIVVCDRGTNARVNKSQAVADAGGLGVILANTSPNTLNADIHAIPTVHVDEVAGAAIKAYVNADPATAKATLSPGVPVMGALAPDIASFSSRGPARAGGGNLLKPDIMAPGVDILAAVSPAGSGGLNYNFYSGTSMSSPHIAGIAALLKNAHPEWSVMAIKSAMMTTASRTRNDGTAIPGNPFGYGAGQVVPNSAVDPGLVYDSSWRDWAGFLCGVGQLLDARCPMVQLNPSDLNYASIAIGSLAGSQTVSRRVTNVSKVAETYTASVTGLAGLTVEVTPATLTLKPQETKSFTVKFTRVDAALNTYAFGSLVWTGDKGHVATSQLAIRPVALSAPAQVSGSGADINYNVTFGYDGTFLAEGRGLVPAQTFDGAVNTNEVLSFDVVVPAGTTYARFSLFNANTAPDSDLDLEVYRGSTLVGSSGGGTSDEEVNLLNPSAATYTVDVIGFATGNPTNFTLFAWVLGSTAAGNMTVSAPATAVTGTTGAVTLSFSGLAPATKYLGSVAYSGVSGMPNPTIVRVDTTATGSPAPEAALPDTYLGLDLSWLPAVQR